MNITKGHFLYAWGVDGSFSVIEESEEIIKLRKIGITPMDVAFDDEMPLTEPGLYTWQGEIHSEGDGFPPTLKGKFERVGIYNSQDTDLIFCSSFRVMRGVVDYLSLDQSVFIKDDKGEAFSFTPGMLPCPVKLGDLVAVTIGVTPCAVQGAPLQANASEMKQVASILGDTGILERVKAALPGWSAKCNQETPAEGTEPNYELEQIEPSCKSKK